MWRSVVVSLCLGLTLLGNFASVLACPFCAAVQQTLRQEMETMDAVVLARLEGKPSEEGQAQFRVLEVLKGETLVSKDQLFSAAYFGTAAPNTTFLLMGVDPPELMWSSPLPLTDESVKYVRQLRTLPPDPADRLKFFMGFFEHKDTLLARDAYDEFALAPYADIKLIKDSLDRDQLVEWIKDINLPADRKRLYLTLLGICGSASDALILEPMMSSEDRNQKAGLDAMIACYLTLRGADGLSTVDELFLKNKKSEYADTYSAIMALRFHGTEGDVIAKDKILGSLHLILDRPELADLVIPDLARWGDWSQIERLSDLFKNADEKNNWVRVPVVNYLRACPLPIAEVKLKELEQIDPAAVRRATTFFPIPTPANATPTNDSSMNLPDESVPATALPTDIPARKAFVAAPSPTSVGILAQTEMASAPAMLSQRGSGPLALGGGGKVTVPVPPAVANLPANRWQLACVGGTTAAVLLVSMWLVLTGAGNHGLVAATVANGKRRQ